MAEISIFENIMKRNKKTALENKKIIGKALALNIMSSPGAGKTALLEKTFEYPGKKFKTGVIEGDVATSKDANRLKKYGINVYQIKTENYGGGCHLDARMVKKALPKVMKKPGAYDLIIIENVGNLICPADFDLGEDKKVVVLSVTEGEEKPLKYPLMFEIADLMLLNKTDLLPHLDFDVEKLKKNVKKVNKRLRMIEVSAKDGTGIKEWTGILEKWIRQKRKKGK